MQETEQDLQVPTHVYVIYSADILGSEEEIDGMGPFRVASRSYPYATPLAGAWTQTEGDESYDFGYLGDESTPRNAIFYQAGTIDRDGNMPDDDSEQETGEGRHRKWVAELSLEEWQEVASALCIDLAPDGFMPREYVDTMGSITGHGHLDAVCVENTEGWSPTRVIASSLYVSFGSLETDESA